MSLRLWFSNFIIPTKLVALNFYMTKYVLRLLTKRKNGNVWKICTAECFWSQIRIEHSKYLHGFDTYDDFNVFKIMKVDTYSDILYRWPYALDSRAYGHRFPICHFILIIRNNKHHIYACLFPLLSMLYTNNSGKFSILPQIFKFSNFQFDFLIITYNFSKL